MDKYEAIHAARTNALCGFKGGPEPRWRCVGVCFKNGPGRAPHYTVLLQALNASQITELPIDMVSVFKYPGSQKAAAIAVSRLRNGVDKI